MNTNTPTPHTLSPLEASRRPLSAPGVPFACFSSGTALHSLQSLSSLRAPHPEPQVKAKVMEHSMWLLLLWAPPHPLLLPQLHFWPQGLMETPSGDLGWGAVCPWLPLSPAGWPR